MLRVEGPKFEKEPTKCNFENELIYNLPKNFGKRDQRKSVEFFFLSLSPIFFYRFWHFKKYPFPRRIGYPARDVGFLP
jgi:hypothetical protein